MVAGALSPLGSQLGLGDAGELRLPGGERRDPRAVAGVDSEAFHLGDDLGAAARERPAHVAADADDLGDAVAIHLVEHETETGDELPAQGRLEDRLGGVALSIERLAVERGAPAVGSLGRR